MQADRHLVWHPSYMAYIVFDYKFLTVEYYVNYKDRRRTLDFSNYENFSLKDAYTKNACPNADGRCPC